MTRHIRGAADLVLMPRDQHSVTRRDQIRLDVIRALQDGKRIGSQRVFRQMAAGTAVRNQEGCIHL